MADWTDGAEYAPIERPDGFATPRTSPLDDPDPVTDLAAGQPAVAPQSYQAPDAAPLETLQPSSTGPQRDPRQAFDTNGAAFTGESAWGAAHSADGRRSPLTPFSSGDAQAGTAVADAGWAPPGGAPAFPAPQGNPVPGTQPNTQLTQPPMPGLPAPPGGTAPGQTGQFPTFAQRPDPFQSPRGPVNQPSPLLWLAVAALVLGGIVRSMSVPLFLVAAVLVFAVRPANTTMRAWMGGLGIFLVAFGGLMALAAGPGQGWYAFSGMGRLTCWVGALVVLLGSALRGRGRR